MWRSALSRAFATALAGQMEAFKTGASTLSAERLQNYPDGTLFVVYCAGPHCNGADKAAIRLARLGRPVKEMIGGITGWLDEGYALDPGADIFSAVREQLGLRLEAQRGMVEILKVDSADKIPVEN